MPNHRPPRTAPHWVRSLADQALHGLAGKLQRIEHTPGAPFSDRQSWLLDAAIAELTWRAARDRRDGITSCTCAFCFGPFDDDQGDLGAPWSGA